MRAGRARRRACAPVAGRDHRRCAACRDPHDGGQGRLRQPGRRARAEAPLRARDARRPRRADPRRARRGGRAARLSRRDPEGRGILLDAPRRIAPREPHGDRRRDPRQPRADALDRRRAQRAACSARSTAARPPPAPPAGRGHRRAADRQGARSRRGSRWSPGCTRTRSGASECAPALKAHARFRARAGAARGGPREPARPCAAARRPRRRRGAAGASSKARPTGRPCSTRCCRGSAAMTRWSRRCRRALVASPPIDASKGGYIAEGYDAALDALARRRRRTAAGRSPRSKRATATATGVASLKIRHNAVLGYHIEVSARHADRLMAPDSGFTHRQTLAGVVRFNSPELHEEAAQVVEAGSHALAAEAAHAEELTQLALAARRADHRHRRSGRPDRRRRKPRRARRRGRLDAAAADRRAVPRNRGRPSPGRRELRSGKPASASSPTICRSARPTGCG